MNKIKTFDGTLALKSNCKKIKNLFYEMNRQCFLMPDDKWHRINNGKICYDHEKEQHGFINSSLSDGVVGCEKDGTTKLGFFTKRIDKNVDLSIKGKTFSCLNRDVVEKLDAVECIGDSTFYIDSPEVINKKNPKQIYRSGYSKRMDYRCGYRLNEITNSFNELFVGEEFKHQFYKLLPNITFGIEYETYDGRIPEDLMMKNGLIPVKDGSLRRENSYQPFEYATIIHSGKTGLQAIKEQCKLMTKYCDKHTSGALHIHIGNIKRTKNYVSSVFILALKLQDEIYSMFPPDYIQTSKFKGTGTDYCNPLKKLVLKNDPTYNFTKIASEVCGVSGWQFNEFGEEHPADPGGDHKWNVASRYKIINLIPLIFGKSGTVEFRIHGSTFNHDKITNWLYIISAIVKFADKYKNEIASHPKMISEITLAKVLSEIYSDSNILSAYLSNYVDYRKAKMIEYRKLGDTCGVLDLKNDDISDFKSQIESLTL